MPVSVHISKFDETVIKIDAEQSVLRELWDRFSYFVPNHEFTTAFKNGYWDGKKRLFHVQTRKLAYGLHTLVKEFCDEHEYECIYVDPIDVEHEFSINEFRQMIASLSLTTMDDGKVIDIVPHSYQESAVIHAIQATRSLLLSPTSSGKSLMLYILMRYYFAKTKSKILVIVPNTTLVRQLFGDFGDYSTKSTWNVEANCHLIYDGAEKHTDKRVTITTWQALAVKERLPKELREEYAVGKTESQVKAFVKKWNAQADYILDEDYFKQFGTVFGDECHLFSSEDPSGGGELLEIMNKLVKATYRIGTTGTLKDGKVHHLILEGIFGKVYKTTTTREMIDSGKAADLFIKCLVLQYSDDERKAMKKKTYPEEMEFLQSYLPRNKFIRNLALSLEGNTLVLFEKVEKHGKILHEMIKAHAAEGRKIFYVHGKVATDVRNEVRRITEGETNAIIVASYGTFSTGINIRNINNLVFASPTKAKVRVLQSIGRGLRLSSRKTKVILFDISDDLSHRNKTGSTSRDNYSLQHFTERVNYYAQEEHKYKLYKIELLGLPQAVSTAD